MLSSQPHGAGFQQSDQPHPCLNRDGLEEPRYFPPDIRLLSASSYRSWPQISVADEDRGDNGPQLQFLFS